MGSLLGEAEIEGTGVRLVFDYKAIDRIESQSGRSIFDLIDEISDASEKAVSPRLSTMAVLLWGAHLAHAPNFQVEEAAQLVVSGDLAPVTAMASALAAAFPQREVGKGATANPTKSRKATG